jgi:hypothetical protein
MMKTVLWIVGEPAVGKTTLASSFLREGQGLIGRLIPKPKWTVNGTTVAAGHYSGEPFDGADTIPYNGAKEALDYWFKNLLRSAQLTIFDGDRLSNQPTIENIKTVQEFCRNIGGLRMACILLIGDEKEIADRRTARSDQDEVWVRGRRTKAMNFAMKFPDRVVIETVRLTEREVFAEAKTFLEHLPCHLPTTAVQTGMFAE